MIHNLAETDETALHRAAVLLDAVGRRTQSSTVALHSLAAAQLLAAAGVDDTDDQPTYGSEQTALRRAIDLFARIDANAFHDEDLLSALDHVLLAHLAAR